MADPSWKKILAPKFPEVVETLRPSLLLDRLVGKGLLDFQEYGYIRNCLPATEEERSRRLLAEILTKKGPQSYDLFCEALLEVPAQAFIAIEILGCVRPVGGPNADRSQMSGEKVASSETKTSSAFIEGHQVSVDQPVPLQMSDEASPSEIVSQLEVNPWGVLRDPGVTQLLCAELRFESNFLTGLKEAKIITAENLEEMKDSQKQREYKLILLLREILPMCRPGQFLVFFKVLTKSGRKMVADKLMKKAHSMGWSASDKLNTAGGNSLKGQVVSQPIAGHAVKRTAVSAIPGTVQNQDPKLSTAAVSSQNRQLVSEPSVRHVVEGSEARANLGMAQLGATKQPDPKRTVFVRVHSKYKSQYKQIHADVQYMIEQHFRPEDEAWRPLKVELIFPEENQYDRDEEQCYGGVEISERTPVMFSFPAVSYEKADDKKALLVEWLTRNIPGLLEDEIMFVGLHRNGLIYVVTIPGDAALQLLCLLKNPLPEWSLALFGPVKVQFHGLASIEMKFQLPDIIDTMLHGEYPVDDLVPSLDKAELKLALRDVQKVELLMSQRLTGLMASLQQANTMGSSAITEDKRRVVLSASTAFSAVLSRMRRAKSVSSTLVQFRDNLNIDKDSSRLPRITCKVYQSSQNMTTRSTMLLHTVENLKLQLNRCFDAVNSLDEMASSRKQELGLVRVKMQCQEDMNKQRSVALSEATKSSLHIVMEVVDPEVASFARTNWKSMRTSLHVDSLHEMLQQFDGVLHSLRESRLEKLEEGCTRCQQLLEDVASRTAVMMLLDKEQPDQKAVILSDVPKADEQLLVKHQAISSSTVIPSAIHPGMHMAVLDSWDMLRPKFTQVVDSLRPSRLLDHLYEACLLSHEEYRYLRSPSLHTEVERSRELLTGILSRKGPQSFVKFCEVLLKLPSQAYIVTDILGYKSPTDQPVGGTVSIPSLLSYSTPDQVLFELSDEVGVLWKELALELGFRSYHIHAIEEKAANPKDGAFKMLRELCDNAIHFNVDEVRSRLPKIKQKQHDAQLKNLIFPENVHDDKRVCGREQELEGIFKRFWGSNNKEDDIPQFCLQVVNGLGGSGKSSVALKYATQWKEWYGDGVLLFNAESYSSLHMSVRQNIVKSALGQMRRLSLCCGEGSLMEDNQTFLQHVYGKRKVLLLYDGADNLDFLQSYLPRTTAPLHVLLTTRTSGNHPLLSRADKVTSLGRLKTESAVKAVQAWRGKADEELDGEEAKYAARLVSEGPVEGLPLPIAHAGTYMEKTEVSYFQYYHLLKTRQEKLVALILDIEKLLHYFEISSLSEALSKKGIYHPRDLSKCSVEELQLIAVDPKDRYLLHTARKFVMDTDPIHLTWQLDIEKVKETDNDAMELLLFMSFLASKNISERLLRPLVFPNAFLHHFSNSLSTLQSHTLIDVSASNEGCNIDLHPLVQSAVFERLLSQPEELSRRLTKLCQCLLSLLPFTDRGIKQCLRDNNFLSLIPHLYATAEKVGRTPLSEESGSLLLLACRVALILQHVDVAVDLCHEQLKLFSVSGNFHQRFRAFYYMGRVCELLSNPQTAEMHYRNALSIIDGCSADERKRLSNEYEFELIGVIKSLRQANVPNVPVPIEQKAMKDSELVGVDSGIHAPQSYLDVSKEHEKEPRSSSGVIEEAEDIFGQLSANLSETKPKTASETDPISQLTLEVGPDGANASVGDMSLYVPHGAVEEPVMLCSQLYTSHCKFPKVDSSKEEYTFSPVLSLHPDGYQFKQPVSVRFPFNSVPGGWLLILLRANCQEPKPFCTWEEIVVYNTDTGELSTTDNCSYDVSRALLSITHFCLYCWIGKPISSLLGRKNICCSAFGFQYQNGCRIEVVMHDQCESLFQDIKSKATAKQPPRRLFDGPKLLPISQVGEVKCKFEGESWDPNLSAQKKPAKCFWSAWFSNKDEFAFDVKLKEGIPIDKVRYMTLKVSTSTDPTSTVELVVAPELDKFQIPARASLVAEQSETSASLMAKATSEVEARELVEIADLVAGSWAEVATKLSPALFPYGKILEIEERHKKPWLQAFAAFERWKNTYGRNATCEMMIKALCKAHHREQAATVFGMELVKEVSPL